MLFPNCVFTAFFLHDIRSSFVSSFTVDNVNVCRSHPSISRPTTFEKNLFNSEGKRKLCSSLSLSSSSLRESNRTEISHILDSLKKDDDVNVSTSDVDICRITEKLLTSEIMSIDVDHMEIINQAEATIDFWSQTGSSRGAEIIKQMIYSLEEARDDLVTSRMYEMAVDAWLKSSDPNGPEEADKILQNYERQYETRKNELSSVDIIYYHNVMTAISRKGGKKCFDKGQGTYLHQFAEKTEQVLRRVEKLSRNDILKGPNTATYNICIAAYSKCGDGRKAEQLLNEMLKRDIKPDVISYNSVIDSWGRSGEKGSAARAESILNAMKQYQIEPDIISYTGVVFAYTRSIEVDSADKALKILESMEESGLSSNEFVYNAVLDAFAKSQQKDKVKKADALLSKMISKGLANNVSFNALLNCYAKSAAPGAGSNAESLLKRMEQSDEYKPDVISYTSVIDALTKSRDKNAAERAQKILERMLKFANEGDVTVKPNAVTYNTVINSWASSGRPDAAKKAETLLQRMEKIYENGECKKARPNTISYTSVIDAYARSKSKNNALDAERVFKRMEEKYAGGNVNAKPNVHSFNTVINAWVQSREPGCALRAEQVLIKMLQHYRNGNKDVKPNVVSFSTVINGWAKCSSEEAGAAKRAEKIFNLMLEEYKGGNEDAKPNSISYCSLIDACVKSRDRGSLERAEDIYNGIYQNYVGENDDMKPSTVLANQIMDAWSKSGQDCGGEKSEGMLNRLITLYKEYGDAEFKPNDRSFTIVINAYAKSRRFRKAKKAREILDQMISAYKDGNSAAKPNVFSFTAVINACAFTVGDDLEKNEAMQIAIAAYKLLGVYDSPNHVTYSCFLKACLNLIPKGPSQESALITVFKKCREHGQVTDMILKLLLRTLTPQQVEKIVGVNGTISIENIPDDWKFKGNSAKKQVRP